MILIDSSDLPKGNLTFAQSLINCEEKNKANLFLNLKIEILVQASNENAKNSNQHFSMIQPKIYLGRKKEFGAEP